MTTYCYFNGKIIPQSKAQISAADLGILRAYAVFDFFRTYDGKPFLFKEHMARFRNSAKLLGIKVPVSDKEVREIVSSLMQKNKMKDASIRIVITGGETFGAKYDDKKRTFYIFTEPILTPDPKFYKNGAKVITYEYQRAFPVAKTTHYTVALSDATRRKKENALETLFVYNGKILEATTSNFFLIKGDTIVTPKDNVLLGMTRSFVLELAKNSFDIEERDIVWDEIYDASEAFLTATNKEIVPIIDIDGKKIGNGQVGEKTKHLMQLFAETIKNQKSV